MLSQNMQFMYRNRKSLILNERLVLQAKLGTTASIQCGVNS